MGRALLEESTVFAQAATDCDAALRPYTGWSVLSVLRGDQGEGCPPSERVDVIQPARAAALYPRASAGEILGQRHAQPAGGVWMRASRSTSVWPSSWTWSR
jgi:acyl transferase domain-containing protein